MEFSSVLNNKTILITGGTGSFGHQMVRELIHYKPKSVRIFSRDEDKQRLMHDAFSKTTISKKLEFFLGDVRDYDRLYTVSKDTDIIFHAAALKQVPSVEFHPYEAVKTNINGAYNVVKAAVARKVKKVVAISTDKAVKPVNAMGMTKALQEKIILSDDLTKDGTKFCCVRYGNVLGSRGSIIPVWDSKLNQSEPLPITHPDMTRFLLTLSDAISLVFYSLKNTKGNEIFIKKSPAAKITDLALAYAELKTGKKNYPIDFIGIRPGEKIHETLVSEEEMCVAKKHDDYFIIRRNQSYDKTLVNRLTKHEYNSGTINHLNVYDLKQIIKKLQWTV